MADNSPSRPSVAVRRRRGPASVRYYVCVAILAVAVVTMPILARSLGAYFRKEAVPLKRSLRLLDREKLGPQYRAHPLQPGQLNEESLQALGTEEYLQVRFIPRSDPGLVAEVFITYHTGQPDMVPHVPEECYLAGGYDRVGRPETVQVPVPGVGAPGDRIPVRVVEFQARQGQARPVVLYFFHANGEYKTTRTGVRVRLGNPFERYAYYAKIEVKFARDVGYLQRARYPGKEESLAAIGPLLRKLMPVVLEDHFNWEGVTAGPAQAGER